MNNSLSPLSFRLLHKDWTVPLYVCTRPVEDGSGVDLHTVAGLSCRVRLPRTSRYGHAGTGGLRLGSRDGHVPSDAANGRACTPGQPNARSCSIGLSRLAWHLRTRITPLLSIYMSIYTYSIDTETYLTNLECTQLDMPCSHDRTVPLAC